MRRIDKSLFLHYYLIADKQSDKEAVMLDSLSELEGTRAQLFRQLQDLGDLRRGTISVAYRKCGKNNCVCAHEEHPGHGPQYLWNATINGKSYAKNLKPGPEMEKYRQETDAHRQFVRLCSEIVILNEQICALRPIPLVTEADDLIELKKKLQQRFPGRSIRK